MRADMAKVIVERPRYGGTTIKGRRRNGDIEDLPTVEGIRRGRGRTRQLNDYLSPLRRFLGSRVGRRWDDVYAETRAQISPVSTVQQHILSHLFQWVAVKTRVVAEEIVVHDDRFLDRGPKRLQECHFELYVHPVSKRLLRNPFYASWKRHVAERRARDAAELAARRRDLSPDRQLHRLRGLWFEVRLAPVPWSPPGAVYDAVRDAGLSRLPPEKLYGRRHVYAQTKRQISRRELKAYGLSNDRED